jgi:hypothetical protein
MGHNGEREKAMTQHITPGDAERFEPGVDYTAVYSQYSTPDPNVFTQVTVTRYGLDRANEQEAFPNVSMQDEARIHADLQAQGFRRVSASSQKEGITMYYQRSRIVPAPIVPAAQVELCEIATHINHATKLFNAVTIRYADAGSERQQVHHDVSQDNERRFRANLLTLGWQMTLERKRMDGTDYRFERKG